MPEKIHFVTGKLAATSLNKQLEELSQSVGFAYTVDILPITVAALMTADWVGKKINVPEGTDRVIIPGYCGGDLEQLAAQLGVPVECGPRDLHALPEYFGAAPVQTDFGKYTIEVIAEINLSLIHI